MYECGCVVHDNGVISVWVHECVINTFSHCGVFARVCVQYILAIHYFTVVPVEHSNVNRAGLKSDAEGISGKINCVCVRVSVCV